MAGKSNTVKSNAIKSNTVNKGGSEKPRISAQEKKIRAQQIGMGIFGLILVLAMILSLVVR